ncbi:MAG TPA: PQQ-dependent sugar dehydrogenase [Thermoanaerobaculia bacterium]
MRTLATFLALALAATAGADQKPRLADGFTVDVFARDLEHARMLLALPDGTVLVSRPKMNDVLALRDTDGDGRADRFQTAVASVEQAHGLAMRGRTLYVAGVTKIVAAVRQNDGSFGTPRVLVDDLPDGGAHPNRTIGVGPDGKLYVSIGSSCNECDETNPEHATMLQMNADGSNRRIYARGLRNVVGFDWHPQTKELWGADDGELNRVGDGLDYGWPLCTGKQQIVAARGEPEGTTKAKVCGASAPSLLELPPKASPTGFVFYRGEAFPEPFRNDAFSVWREESKIVRIRYNDGAAASVEDFVSGIDGRLAGLAVTEDGTLLFSDDAKGVIYRVAYGAGNTLPPSMTSSASDVKPVLARMFKVDGLRAPESVIHDEEQDVYFVSNGAGFISKISPEGKIAALRFIDGLNAPRGMAIRGRQLWVADGTQMRAFDRTTGDAIHTLPVAGAVLLADVALGSDGAIYVTDMAVRLNERKERVRTGTDRIYRLNDDGEFEVALTGEDLNAPNGIAWDGTRFVIAQNYGRELLAWRPGTHPRAIVRGPGAYEGVVVLPNGSVLVSSGHDDAIHVVRGDRLEPLFARRPTPADIGFDAKRNHLLIPSTNGDWLEAWKLPPMELREATTSRGDDEPEYALKDTPQ